jgi:uncharacterized delta-60 repeat protein
LLKYKPNGYLDSTFGHDGKVSTDILNHTDEANSIQIQKDNKIVVGGSSGSVSYERNFLVLRYKTNGELDSSFGKNGVVETAFSGSSDNTGTSLAIQNDSKIILGGWFL